MARFKPALLGTMVGCRCVVKKRLWATVASSVRHVVQTANDLGGNKSRGAREPSSVELATKRVDKLAIPEDTKQNLQGMGFTSLSDIQAKAFFPILRGHNFVGRSHTGTGKTIAYLLPVLERMRHEKITASHSVLVLVPTRELCKQVGGTILSLAVTINVALVFGGPSFTSQEQLVRLGAQIVVATPGRCALLVERGALETQNVQVLILDEADAMLSLEYFGRVEKVLTAVTKRGLQSILFSASLPADVLEMINKHIHNYDFVDLVARGGKSAPAVVQAVTHQICKAPSAKNARSRVLLHLLATKLDLELGGRCIIFVDSTAEAKSLLGHPALDRRARSLHSDSTTQDRDFIITAFANREFDVLITTDIISRGVDFEDISLVLQLHPPRDAAQYVHRAGRTGRAGHGGTVIMLYDPSEYKLVQRVRELTKQKFLMLATPMPQDIHHAGVSRILEELLLVQPSEYEPFLHDAEQLLEQQGLPVLSTAMAILDSRHATLERASKEIPSLLTGRKQYVCILAHDPGCTTASTTTELIQIIKSLLPERASDTAVGCVTKTITGWAFDISRPYALPLMEDLRIGRRTAPFEISIARRLPRLTRVSTQRSRRLPWASMRKQAFKKQLTSKELLSSREKR